MNSKIWVFYRTQHQEIQWPNQASTVLHDQKVVAGLQKMFSLSGTIKSNGQHFLSNMCTKHTSQAHSVMSSWAGSGHGYFDALWCNLHLYLNLFCVNIIIFYFLVLNIFCGSFFFWDRRSHGPVDFVGLGCGFKPHQCPCVTSLTETLILITSLLGNRLYKFTPGCIENGQTVTVNAALHDLKIVGSNWTSVVSCTILVHSCSSSLSCTQVIFREILSIHVLMVCLHNTQPPGQTSKHCHFQLDHEFKPFVKMHKKHIPCRGILVKINLNEISCLCHSWCFIWPMVQIYFPVFSIF